MGDDDEKKALMEELERLREQAEAAQGETVPSANSARQREIIDRLADLGVQLG